MTAAAKKRETQTAADISEAIVNTIHDPLLILNGDLKVVSSNPSFYAFFHAKAENTIGKLVYELQNHQWDIPALRRLLEEIIPAGTHFDNYEVAFDFPDIGRHLMLLNARRLPRPPAKPQIIILAMEDITERRLTEDLLIQSEARYRKIVSTIMDYIYTVSIEKGVVVQTTYSPACLAVTGYTPEEFIANPVLWIEMVPEPDRPLVQDWSDRILKGKQAEPLEHRIIRKDHAIRWIRNTPVLHTDNKGELASYDGIIQDITDTRMAVQDRAIAETLAAIMEGAPNAIIVVDVEGRIVQCNHAVLSNFGHGNEMVGKFISDIFSEGDKPKITCGVKECLKNGRDTNRELTVVAKDQQLIPVLINSSLLQSAQGHPKDIIMILTDITERKNDEWLNEQKARAIFDQTYQFIGLMTTDGTLIEANRSAMQFGGFTTSQVLFKPFWETPWWNHSPELQEQLRKAITKAASGEFVRFEATHVAKDGKVHYIDFSLKPLKDKAGKVIYLIPEGRDITEHKHTEEELRKYREHLEELLTLAQYS